MFRNYIGQLRNFEVSRQVFQTEEKNQVTFLLQCFYFVLWFFGDNYWAIFWDMESIKLRQHSGENSVIQTCLRFLTFRVTWFRAATFFKRNHANSMDLGSYLVNQKEVNTIVSLATWWSILLSFYLWADDPLCWNLK